MKPRTPLINQDGEVRELSAEDMKRFRPAKEVLSSDLYTGLVALKKGRGPNKAPTKVVTTIRLSPEVIQAFKAAGAGWQKRIDNALKDWLKEHQVT